MKTNFRGYFAVTLPLSQITERVYYRSLEVHQSADRHDMAVIEVTSKQLRYFAALGPGTPVKIEYGNDRGAPAVFVGYVAKVNPESSLTNNVYRRRIVCVAASRDLRRTAQQTWNNKTAPEIVTAIGQKFGYDVVTKQHGLRRKQIVQGGKTYWELLNRLAAMTGYVLRVEGTTMYFLPLADMVKGFSSLSVTLADVVSSSESSIAVLETELSLGNTSDDDDYSADAAVVVSLGPNDANPQWARKAPASVVRGQKQSSAAYERYSPGVVAHSRKDADLLAQGMADRGMLAFDGRTHGQGSPLLAPYRPVYLDITDTTASGWWIVKRVVHKIVEGEYTCETTISTDEVSPQKASPLRKMFRDVAVEMSNGWSPSTKARSKLRVLQPSFVKGKTQRQTGQVAQWVSV